LEVFCLKAAEENEGKPLPEYCNAPKVPSYECLRRKCPYLDFTSCENTLCYINERSEIETGILFGGDMECEGDNTQNLNIWKTISIDAVNASYEKYMRQKNGT
jgi:hypothetical protein